VEQQDVQEQLALSNVQTMYGIDNHAQEAPDVSSEMESQFVTSNRGSVSSFCVHQVLYFRLCSILGTISAQFSD
jgi:hypothetical protein